MIKLALMKLVAKSGSLKVKILYLVLCLIRVCVVGSLICYLDLIFLPIIILPAAKYAVILVYDF